MNYVEITLTFSGNVGRILVSDISQNLSKMLDTSTQPTFRQPENKPQSKGMYYENQSNQSS